MDLSRNSISKLGNSKRLGRSRSDLFLAWSGILRVLPRMSALLVFSTLDTEDDACKDRTHHSGPPLISEVWARTGVPRAGRVVYLRAEVQPDFDEGTDHLSRECSTPTRNARHRVAQRSTSTVLPRRVIQHFGSDGEFRIRCPAARATSHPFADAVPRFPVQSDEWHFYVYIATGWYTRSVRKSVTNPTYISEVSMVELRRPRLWQ